MRHRLLPLLLGSMLTAPLAALADPSDTPEVRVADDGTVVAHLLIDGSPELIKQTIREIQDARFHASVLDLTAKPDGDCSLITRTTRGVWRPLEMRTRLCPTAGGWREKLIESTDFDAYDTEWDIAADPASGRMRVQLAMKSDLAGAVPDALVRQATISGVKSTFATLLKQLLGKQEAGQR